VSRHESTYNFHGVLGVSVFLFLHQRTGASVFSKSNGTSFRGPPSTESMVSHLVALFERLG